MTAPNPRQLRWALAVLLCSALWGMSAQRLRARDLPVVPLALHTPARCVEPAALDALAERLGVQFTLVARADLTVHIAATQSGFEARVIDARGGEETRRFSGAACEQVAQAAALIVALSAQPMSVSQRVASSTPVEPPRERPRSLRLQHVHLSAEPTLDWGSLPRFTVGLAAAVGGRVGPLLGELTGAAYLPRSTREGPTRAASAELTLATAGARFCHAFTRRYVSLGPCVGAELGAAWARGLAVRGPRQVTGRWSALAFGLLLIAHGQRLAPGLRVEAVVPLQRPAFDVDGYGEVFQARHVALRAAWLMRLDVF